MTMRSASQVDASLIEYAAENARRLRLIGFIAEDLQRRYSTGQVAEVAADLLAALDLHGDALTSALEAVEPSLRGGQAGTFRRDQS